MAVPPPPKVLTEEEYRHWLTPKQAIERVGTALNNYNGIHRAILRRVASGKLLVHAEEIDWVRGSKSGSFVKYSPVPEPVLKAWEDSDHPGYLGFWNVGDAELDTRTGFSHMDPNIEWKIFGIRFDPAGIAKMTGQGNPAPVAPPKPDPMPQLPPAPADAPEPEAKGTPVSASALAAWFEAYKLAFIGKDETEAKAMESAKGCFPGKSFSRDAVRALRGAQKRGPKAKTAK